jgi:hypothetical protein
MATEWCDALRQEVVQRADERCSVRTNAQRRQQRLQQPQLAGATSTAPVVDILMEYEAVTVPFKKTEDE